MMKILHAPNEIAGQMGTLSRAQQKLGYYSRSCTYSNSWFEYKCDNSLNLEQLTNKYHRRYRILRFFFYAAVRYNIFHFYFGNSLLPRNYDLPLLKKMNKKMVMHYLGSDIRQKSIAERKNRFVKVKIEDEKLILDGIRRVSKLIKTAIVGDHESYEYVQDHFERVVIVRQAIALHEYKPAIPSADKKKPFIVHAPSDKGIKGTEHVLEAVSRLKRDHDFEFVLVHGLAHEEAKGIYAKADVIVDQLLGGAYGVFAVEAMALGKPVICYIREDLKDKYPRELPIVSANPENIQDALKSLITDPKLRHKLGRKGRAYAEQYHDAEKIARQLIELYEGL